MKHFDFNFDILGLDKTPIVNAGKLLASALSNGNKGDAIKVYHWALSLYNGEPLHLDKSDEKTLKELIENDQTITILGKAQLLEAFDKTPAVYPTQPE